MTDNWLVPYGDDRQTFQEWLGDLVALVRLLMAWALGE